MPEMHLRQPGFTYSIYDLLKTKKEFKNLKKQEIQLYLQTSFSFQHDMAYGDFKDIKKKNF